MFDNDSRTWASCVLVLVLFVVAELVRMLSIGLRVEGYTLRHAPKSQSYGNLQCGHDTNCIAIATLGIRHQAAPVPL